jgi:hypothetical protein
MLRIVTLQDRLDRSGGVPVALIPKKAKATEVAFA